MDRATRVPLIHIISSANCIHAVREGLTRRTSYPGDESLKPDGSTTEMPQHLCLLHSLLPQLMFSARVYRGINFAEILENIQICILLIHLRKAISILLVSINSVTAEKGIVFRVKCVGWQGEKEAHRVPEVGWGGDVLSQDSSSEGKELGRLKTLAPGLGDLFAFHQHWEPRRALCGVWH